MPSRTSPKTTCLPSSQLIEGELAIDKTPKAKRFSFFFGGRGRELEDLRVANCKSQKRVINKDNSDRDNCRLNGVSSLGFGVGGRAAGYYQVGQHLRGDDSGDEELGAIGVLAGVGHAQETGAGVLRGR